MKIKFIEKYLELRDIESEMRKVKNTIDTYNQRAVFNEFKANEAEKNGREESVRYFDSNKFEAIAIRDKAKDKFQELSTKADNVRLFIVSDEDAKHLVTNETINLYNKITYSLNKRNQALDVLQSGDYSKAQYHYYLDFVEKCVNDINENSKKFLDLPNVRSIMKRKIYEIGKNKVIKIDISKNR